MPSLLFFGLGIVLMLAIVQMLLLARPIRRKLPRPVQIVEAFITLILVIMGLPVAAKISNPPADAMFVGMFFGFGVAGFLVWLRDLRSTKKGSRNSRKQLP